MNDIIAFTVVYPAAIDYTKDFISCINSQTYSDFDILILNDGCDRNYLQEQFAAYRIEILDVADTPSKNREIGIRYAYSKGYKYLIFCDYDDWFASDRFTKVIHYLKDNDIVVNNLNIVGENRELLCPNYFNHSIRKDTIIDLDFLKDKNILGLSNTAIRLSENLLVDIPRNISIADWYYFTICLSRSMKTIYISESLTDYRQHSNNLIGIDDFSVTLFRKMINLKIEHYMYVSKHLKQFTSLLEQTENLLNLTDVEIERHIKENKKINNHPLWWENIK